MRLNDTVAEFRLQWGQYSETQFKAKLSSMVKNGEPQMNNLGCNLDLKRCSYEQMCEIVRFYDISEEGAARLKNDGVRA